MRKPLGIAKPIVLALAGLLITVAATHPGHAAPERYVIDISLLPNLTTEVRVVAPSSDKLNDLSIVLMRKDGARHEYSLRGGATLADGCRLPLGPSASRLQLLAPLDQISYSLAERGGTVLASVSRNLGAEAASLLAGYDQSIPLLRNGSRAPDTAAAPTKVKPIAAVTLPEDQKLVVNMPRGGASAATTALLFLIAQDRWFYSDVIPVVGGALTTGRALPAGTYGITVVTDSSCPQS
ncbi:MAG: hypothetical protein HQL41_04895 [Alphaproteobacteria bacterium]|nr:hypothetical protein [Alphaproteobacteria bacterium]